MNDSKRISEIIETIINKGSEISYIDDLKNTSEEIIRKDYSLEDSLNDLANNIKILTEDFLNSRNSYGTRYISGISSCIYLPDFSNNGEYKLKILGGSRDRDIDLKIDEDTLFDVASITKVYTLLLLFKLEQEGLIDLNSKITDVNPEFDKMEDFTFNDLIRLHGEIGTEQRVTDVSSYVEAYAILRTAFLKSNTRKENKYTDFGAIIMSKTIEKILSEKLGREMNFSDIMDEFLLKPLNLKHTMFNPQFENTTGSGNLQGIVHDPKARILGGAVGSAGLFVNSDDLATLARNMYSVKYINSKFLKPEYLSKFGEITFPHSGQSHKGNLGIYVKHPKGLEQTYTPSEFSTGSFSHQGWTGPVANFDPNNLIHQNILVNAIYEDEDKNKVRNDKPVGYGVALDSYLGQMTKNTMIMLVVKKYYNMYCNEKKDIESIIKVK